MTSRTPRIVPTLALSLAAGAASAQPVPQPVDLEVYATGVFFEVGTPDTWNASIPTAISPIAGSDDILLSAGINILGGSNTGLWTLDPDSGIATPAFLPEVLQPGIPTGGRYVSSQHFWNFSGDVVVRVHDSIEDVNYIWRRLHDGSTGAVSETTAVLADTGQPIALMDAFGPHERRTSIRSDGTVAFQGYTPGISWNLSPRPAVAWLPNGELRTILGEDSIIDTLPTGAEFDSATAYPIDDESWLVVAYMVAPGFTFGYRPVLLVKDGQPAQTLFEWSGSVPGLPASEQIQLMWSIGSANGHAYFETLSENGRNVIWTVDSDGNMNQILRENYNAPVPQAGAKFDEFEGAYRLRDNGDLLFRAKLSGVPSEVNEGVFVYRAATDSVQLVLQEGRTVPGFDPVDVTFDTRAFWGPDGEIWFHELLGDEHGPGIWGTRVVNDRIVRRWRGPAAEPQLLFAASIPIDLDPDPAIDEPFAVRDIDVFGTDTFAVVRLFEQRDTGEWNFALGRMTIPITCAADANDDGQLTPADFNAWVIAYNSDAPECDQNDDGLCNPADFNAWVLNFNAGC
ncbi:MAG: hypothetical protein AAFS11_01465 [Planctomycetota bacterium]